MLKGVIFDFDGVIVDTEVVKFKDLNMIIGKYNFKILESEFSNFIGKKTKYILEENFPLMPKEIIGAIVKTRKELQCIDLGKYSLVTGIKELLVYLKKNNCRIAIATGSERKFVESLLKLNHLSKYIDFIVSGEDYKSTKPLPECFKITLKKMKLRVDQVIIIEDSIAGIKAAKSLGCRVFGIRTYLNNDELKEADKVFKDHHEILKYIRK